MIFRESFDTTTFFGMGRIATPEALKFRADRVVAAQVASTVIARKALFAIIGSFTLFSSGIVSGKQFRPDHYSLLGSS